MAAYPIPPWLRPTETTAPFIAGAQMGIGVAENVNRLAATFAAQQASIAERQQSLELQRQRLDQQALHDQQQIEVTKAYHDQVIALRQQELEDEREKASLTAEIVGRKFAAQEAYKQALMGGQDPVKAAMLYGPEMGAEALASAGLRESRAAAEMVKAMPVIDAVTGKPIPEFRQFQTATGGWTVREMPREGRMTDIEKARRIELRMRQRDLEKVLEKEAPQARTTEALLGDPKKAKTVTPTAREQLESYKKLLAERDAIKAEMETLNRKYEAEAAAPSALRRVIVNPSTGQLEWEEQQQESPDWISDEDWDEFYAPE